MTVYEYGDKTAPTVLVQMVDDHDFSVLEAEVMAIKETATKPFKLLAVKVDDWNKDLSPWTAPPVFGSVDFGSGAQTTLDYVLSLCNDNAKNYYIGGYSLAGLFALWSSTQTALFKGVAAASPSVWFPNFTAYLQSNPIRSQKAYLSLGNKESKTRNQVMATVADKILECKDIITGQGIECFFEWNEGNHFQNPEKRTAKAFSWLLMHQNYSDSNICRNKMLKLQEDLHAVEEDRLKGKTGCTVDELESYLDDVIYSS